MLASRISAHPRVYTEVDGGTHLDERRNCHPFAIKPIYLLNNLYKRSEACLVAPHKTTERYFFRRQRVHNMGVGDNDSFVEDFGDSFNDEADNWQTTGGRNAAEALDTSLQAPNANDFSNARLIEEVRSL